MLEVKVRDKSRIGFRTTNELTWLQSQESPPSIDDLNAKLEVHKKFDIFQIARVDTKTL